MIPGDLRERLSSAAPELSSLLSFDFGEAVITIDADAILRTAEQLKEIGFNRLVMVTAVDYGEWIVMVYGLHSQSLSTGLFVKAKLAVDDLEVASVYPVWPAADWQEREVFDLFGIQFEGHPDLRRILLPDDFEGHPLRKDYDDPRLIRRPDYI